MKQHRSNQSGIGQLGVIIIVAVILIAGIVGWWIFSKNKDAGIPATLKSAKCDYSDKALCAFFAAQKTNQPYTMTITTKQNGQTTKTVFAAESAQKTHTTITGSTSYETIVIDNTLYTKAADGTWWQQTLATPELDKYNQARPKLPEPTGKTPKVTYKKLGTEACGDLTCLKYEKLDPSAPSDVKQHLWFDTKDYKLRRTQTVTKVSTADASFDYTKITVTAPANAKVLGANQSIAPGQNTPTDLPHTGDDPPSPEELQQFMQYHQ